MKRILSILLAISFLIPAAGITSAQGGGYTETGYGFQTVAAFTNANTNPLSLEDIQNTLGRTFGVTTYTIGGKTFACFGQQYGIKVYDITDVHNVKLIQDGNYIKSLTTKTDGNKVTASITPLFQNDVQYPMKAYRGNVYFSTGVNKNTYVFPINDDGTLAMPVQKNENDGFYTLKGYNRIGRRAIYGMTFIDDDMITLSNGNSNWDAEEIDIYDVSAGTLPTPKSYPTNGYAFCINAVKTASGLYRICYVSNTETDASKAQTTGESIFNVVDYDPQNGEFAPVYSGVLADAEWPEVPAYFRCSPPQFVSETEVILSYGKDNTSDAQAKRKVLAVDFSDLNSIQVKKLYEAAPSSNETRLGWLSQYDEQLIYWNSATKMFDLQSGEIIASMSIPKARICDVDFVGSTAVLALDQSISFVDIEKTTIKEEDVTLPDRILSVGEVETQAVSTGTDRALKPAAMATAKIGNRVYAYIKDNNQAEDMGLIYAYDVTDPADMRPLNVDSETQAPVPYNFSLRSYGTAMAVKDNYLIAANNGTLAFIKIKEDGTLDSQVSKTASVGSNAVNQIEIYGDYLFALSYGQNARVYDISNIDAGITLIYTFSVRARGMTVEQCSSLRSRVYIAQTEDFDHTVDGKAQKTTRLLIFELLKTLQETKITPVFDGIPDLSTVNAWPGLGIYGEDAEVPGYLGFSSTDGCILHTMGNGIVRYVVDRTASGNAGYNDILIDAADPHAPKVVGDIQKEIGAWTPRQYRIDKANFLEQAQNGSSGYITQYQNPAAPNVLYTIQDMNGYALSAADGIAYAAGENILKAVRLYQENTGLLVSDILVTDESGSSVSDVSSGMLTASAAIDNQTGSPADVCMAVAMFDKQTDRMEHVQLTKKRVTGYETVRDTIDLQQLSDYSAYTKYVKVFLWDGAMTPLTAAKKVNAIEIDGVKFDIWLPQNTPVVKGLMVMYAHGNSSSLKDLPAFQSLLAGMDMGCMTVAENTPDGTMKAFADPDLCGGFVLSAISGFAKSTSHPELVNVPIMTYGHSNGNQFGAGLAAWMPERVIATVVYKPAFPAQYERDALGQVPVLLIEGELDVAYGGGTHGHFEAAQRMRQKGGLVNYVMDPNAGHGANQWKSNSIVFPFLEAAFALRVPADADPLQGVVVLNSVDPAIGYIGTIKTTTLDTEITADGGHKIQDRTFAGTFVPYTTAYPSGSVAIADADWLPNEAYARQWAEFLENGEVSGIQYQ